MLLAAADDESVASQNRHFVKQTFINNQNDGSSVMTDQDMRD
jgi:hypothetical protein